MSDNRKVSTDALETLGTIIDEKAGRDAIHLAVEPVIAATKLYPGQDVGFVSGGVGVCDKPLGIVDPFLKAPVHPGDRFWLVVYPRQITSLRHVWEHPAFEASQPPEMSKEEQKAASEKWLRDFCAKSDCPSYETILQGLNEELPDSGYDNFSLDEEYMHFGGSDAHGNIPGIFWDHVEVVLGKEFPRARHFSCSC